MDPQPGGSDSTPRAPDLDLALDRDVFLHIVLQELSGTLEEIVGLEEADDLVSVVGAAMGTELDRLDREQVAQVLVDLKRRIEGDFYVIEEHDERIVLGNRACPFGDKVLRRLSLCMMTSNVFGSIAAENLGCRIVLHLRPDDEASMVGREYFAVRETATS